MNSPTTLEDLEAQIAKLERLIAEHSAIIRPVEEKFNKAKDGKTSIQDTFNKEMLALQKRFEDLIVEANQKILEAQLELNKLQAENSDALSELEKLKLAKMKLLEEQAAQEKLQSLHKKFLEIYDNSPFAQKLRSFQFEDLQFLVQCFEEGKSGVLNANEMGLGKTVEAAAFDYYMQQLFPEKFGRLPRTLWITKRSLMRSSHREIMFWNPDRKVVMLQGDKTQREFMVELAVANNLMVMCNYEALHSTPALTRVDWDILFIDEVHKLKGGASSNPTKIWQAVRDIIFEMEDEINHAGKVVGKRIKMEHTLDGSFPIRRVKFCKFLSGSPIQNRPHEMWAYLHLFDPQRFSSIRRFERDYCFMWPEVKINWDRLINVLKGQVIRRRKDEVYDDLPDKEVKYYYVELGKAQREIYQQMKDRFFVWLDQQKTKNLTATAILAQLTRLRQITVYPGAIEGLDEVCNDSAKLDEACDIIEELVANGEQVVVWSSQFNPPLHALKDRLDKMELKFPGADGNDVPLQARILEGATSDKAELFERKFQEGKLHVLLVNSKTGGEGLNLQKAPDKWPGGASHAIFLDLWWNPKFNEQCEDRIWRDGIKNKVIIHIIQADQTVDAFIASKLEEKEQMIEGIMERDEIRVGMKWKEILDELI